MMKKSQRAGRGEEKNAKRNGEEIKKKKKEK